MEPSVLSLRCYACLTPGTAETLQDTTLPGLCPSCRQRSHMVRDRLARTFPQQFPVNYFAAPRVDPPVLKSDRRCGRCGLLGSSFGWTRWRERHDEGNPTIAKVEGDAFAFCTNCETLMTDPWRRTFTPGPTGGHASALDHAERPEQQSLLFAELLALFFVSVAILALLL